MVFKFHRTDIIDTVYFVPGSVFVENHNIMDSRQRLAVLVLLIYLVPPSSGNDVISNGTLNLLEDHTITFQTANESVSIIEKEKNLPLRGNLIFIETSSDIIESPSVINDELISLLDQQNQNITVFSDRQRRSTDMDQVKEASRNQLNSVRHLDLEDIDHFQDVIAITEYEPKKVESKKVKENSFHNFGYSGTRSVFFQEEDKKKGIEVFYLKLDGNVANNPQSYHETTTQRFDRIYYEVSQRQGPTRVPSHGKTKVSYDIGPTEKSRYLASQTYRTLPSTFNPPANRKTKRGPSTLDSITSTTSGYLIPSISSANSVFFETQTKNHNNAFTAVTSPNHARSTLNETKAVDGFDSISRRRKATSETKNTSEFGAPTTIFPNIQTQRSIQFYSPRTTKFSNSFADFDEGRTENRILSSTIANDPYKVPRKKKKGKKVFASVLQNSDFENFELSLPDKTRQGRALNRTDGNYKFWLLAKYDIMPRPFALHTQDPLNIAATRAQNKNFGQPLVSPTNPPTLWNFNTITPKSSTFSPPPTSTPPISSTQRMTSRGQARFNIINKDTGIGFIGKDFHNPKYLETSTNNVIASTKPKGQGQHHHDYRDEQDIRKPDYQHRHHLNKKHQSCEEEDHVHNGRHDREEHHPKDERNDKQHHSLSDKHERDHKHHIPKHNYHREYDHNDKLHIFHDAQHEILHGNRHISNVRNYGPESHEHEHDKNNHDSRKDIEHGNDKVEKEDQYHDKNDRHHQDRYHHQDSAKDEPDRSKKDENSDSQEYEYDQDDHQQTDDYSQIVDDRLEASNREKKYHGQDHDPDQKLHDDDHDYIGEHKENEAESTHKHERKSDERKEGGDHKHEARRGSEHEEGHHSEDEKEGDRDHEENKAESTHEHERKSNEKKKSGDYKHEAGGGTEHEEGHHSEEEKKGDKGYESWHENEEAEKGYHDKEDHNHHYNEKKGDKKKHEDQGGYHKEHHFGEKGEKDVEFGEKEEHQTGHNIKGKHFIHKKDEYKKETEFFDEFHDDGDNEKEREFDHEHEGRKGGHHKSGHYGGGHNEKKHGKQHHHMKGHHHKEGNGYKEDKGHEKYHHHNEKHGKKGAHEEGKKWAHRKEKERP